MKAPSKVYIEAVVFALLFTGASFFIGYAAREYAAVYPAIPVTTAVDEPVSVAILLDPGHGGEDGGAVVGDVIEKDLNLAVASALTDLYTLFGYEVRSTRTTDTLLYDAYHDLTDYHGHKKVYDLRNRLRMAEEISPALFVGIHMNNFPEAKYKGTQIYYSPNTDASRAVAMLVQGYTKTYLQPDNTRAIKEADEAIYLLNRMKTPAVLIECGFLSNPEERAALTDPAYRAALACVLFASTAEYLVGNTNLQKTLVE